MKHAFLILAHSGFDVLRQLVSMLDDSRNDIYIHFDSKVKILPELAVSNATLRILSDRVDVRWGDYSVVEAEYALFGEAVTHGPYRYYHLLSGNDLPVKSMDCLHSFFDANYGKEFVGYALLDINKELRRKVCRHHLFPGSFRDAGLIRRTLRAGYLRLQELLGIERNRGIDFKKGTQWVSITEGLVREVLARRAWSDKVFSHTFCPDEIVIQTVCWDSSFRDAIYCIDDESKGCMRAISWRDGEMRSWENGQYPSLCRGEYIFARKFPEPVQPPMAGPLVSVTIPVYNAESTLKDTLNSVKDQDYPDIELCIVDDCSTDSSRAIIEEFRAEFENEHRSCRYLRNPVNKGIAFSRNVALDTATGDWIISVDADDLLDPLALTLAVDTALRNGSDAVSWDWLLCEGDRHRYMLQPDSPTVELTLAKLWSGLLRWNLWLFMFRRSVMEQPSPIRFIPGMNMGEDMLVTSLFLMRASSISFIHQPLYRYIQRSTSISRRMTESNIMQVSANIDALEQYGADRTLLELLKLNIKLPLLISTDPADYRRWKQWYPESEKYILRNKYLPMRTLLLECLAAMRLWGLVRLYNDMRSKALGRTFKKG